MIIYDLFQPYHPDIEQPITHTFRCDILTKAGHLLNNQDVNQYTLRDLQDVVAVRFHKPDHVKALTERAIKEMHWVNNTKNYSQVHGILTWLDRVGLLKVDGQPSTPKDDGKDWLERKMDKLGIRFSGNRRDVRNWFESPAEYPEVHFDIKNAILTKKPSGSGHVVVLPTGHTIAYSTAKQIWWAMNGSYDYLSDHPTVGVYQGRKNWRYSSSHLLNINKNSVSVGCQVVTRQTISEFAEREGWADKPY